MVEKAEHIVVRGVVQGVGFRPTVWRLARQFNIRGSVINNGNGVEIIAQATDLELDNFVSSISTDAPPLSRIDEISRIAIETSSNRPEFHISESVTTSVHTCVVPDARTCEACLAETIDPAGRRFLYPFTNCTHCGPRLSIVQDIPYDRANTTMRGFEMCNVCRSEYEDPADRRFHAQPIACPECGPRIWIEHPGNLEATESFTVTDDADAVRSLLEAGHIVAIKGIGGFQLACDATNEEAVSRLRARKHRECKPFALMVRDMDVARTFCEIDVREENALQSAAAPIVILRSVTSGGVAPSVAPGIRTLGVMLPNTPLHHLIMQRLTRPIVLTSGNLSDEPQCIENAEAVEKLGDIAKYFVMNDRPIAQRVDDSVVKQFGGEMRVLRRARGYAPSPFVMPRGFESAPPVLAFGGELKNTFCLFQDGKVIVSQHIGDLENAESQADYRHNLELYETLYQHEPAVLACDLHPEYLSSKLARRRSETSDIPLIETQHHHAHIASCLAENGIAIDAPPVIGIALDGLGYGDDGTFWGGEFLLADYHEYMRIGTFKPVAMPGAEQAIREPWRNTYAHLTAGMGWAKFAGNYGTGDLFEFLERKPRATLDVMIARGINSPVASSCGRLFDAVAAAIGICRERAFYEGQGAVELEAIVDERTIDKDLSAYPFEIGLSGHSDLPYIEPYPMWQTLLSDLVSKTPASAIAARFHKGLAMTIVQMAEKLSLGAFGDIPVRTVALSGGVWQNKVLFELVIERLGKLGFTVLTHRQFPSNDGGLSLGQAAIAAARLLQEGNLNTDGVEKRKYVPGYSRK